MGYMGFGMRKEVYTRKPKRSFSRLKEIYGENLERFKLISKNKKKWSEKEKDDFRKYIKSRVRQNVLSQDIGSILVYIFTIVIITMALLVAAKIILN